MRFAVLATCNLNQWAMDFEGNLRRIKESIDEARRRGAKYRVGPELEVPGYGCEDHFLELDTVSHSWECIAELLQGDYTCGLLCDVGMPVIHRGVMYNCRVLMLDRRILLIRPKLHLANDGNYREPRYFATWKHRFMCEEHSLPACIRQAAGGQASCPFGDGVLRLADCLLAAETCEELFTPHAPHIDLALAGVEIISNGSGSHHQLRKLDLRLDLIRSATAKAGGVYLYANQRGCDGGRLYFDGCACIAVNGEMVAQGAQFGLAEVEVVVATVDLDEVVSYRSAISSLREQASSSKAPPLIPVEFGLCGCPCGAATTTGSSTGASSGTGSTGIAASIAPQQHGAGAALLPPAVAAAGVPSDGAAAAAAAAPGVGGAAGSLQPGGITTVGGSSGGSCSGGTCYSCSPSPRITPNIHVPEEEIAFGPACWLWDYLRRSGGSGYLLPLSGGADSASTAAIVGAMCQLVSAAVKAGDATVTADAKRVGQYKEGEPVAPDAQEFASRLFTTVYMGTVNSSVETRTRAKNLAAQVGSYHLDVSIDTVVSALVALFTTITGKTPAFRANGGTPAENLALQNIQARLRMVVAFLLAQLVPWVRGRWGFLLVLGSANVDECLRGYLTKYDCSSADINPIGGISKQDLRRFLRWGADNLGYSELAHIEEAPPTAELEPLPTDKEQKAQNDEDDMGMTYAELSIYGRLRKIGRCGPVSMYQQCLHLWRNKFSPLVIADKVKHFFRFYAINRHKATVLTPSYHAESYSPDDNRFDHRQFLYNARWPWQFNKIDQMASAAEAAVARATPAAAAADGQ